jgi:hypothetical protein
MKQLILLLLIPLAFSMKPDISNQFTLTGNWTLICFSDIKLHQQECKDMNESRRLIKLKFTDNGKDGIMTGNEVVNCVYATYKLFENNKIKLDLISILKAGDRGDEWKHRFFDACHNASSYVHKSDTLIIFYEKGTKAMKFVQTVPEIKHNTIDGIYFKGY